MCTETFLNLLKDSSSRTANSYHSSCHFKSVCIKIRFFKKWLKTEPYEWWWWGPDGVLAKFWRITARCWPQLFSPHCSFGRDIVMQRRHSCVRKVKKCNKTPLASQVLWNIATVTRSNCNKIQLKRHSFQYFPCQSTQSMKLRVK